MHQQNGTPRNMQGNQATWCDALFCKMDQFHKKRYFLLDPTLRALIQVPGAGDNDQVGTLSTNWSGQCSHRESAHYPSREDIAVQFVKYKGRVGASLVMSDPPRSFAFARVASSSSLRSRTSTETARNVQRADWSPRDG